jgi:hypothetical protein
MHTTRVLTAAAGALLAVGLAAAPAQAAKALEGSMFLQAKSVIGFPVQASDTSAPSTDSWSDVPTDLSVSARATARFGDNTVVTHGSESAVWQSPDRGSVTVTDFGHEFDVSDGSISQIETQLAGDAGGRQDWSYGFQATEDSVFNLDFDVLGSGDDLFGLGQWQLEFIGDGLEFFTLSDGFASGTLDNRHTGSFSHLLRNGVNYRVSLINLNSLGSFTPNHQSAAMDATFNWSISPVAGVPEPSTWALSILGFGLAGAALRRRNRALA